MIEGRYLYYGDDMQDLNYLKSIFITDRKYLVLFKSSANAISKSIELDEGIYVVIYVAEKPIGMGKLIYDGTDFYIDEVNVMSVSDDVKYTDFIIRMLLEKAILLNCKKIKVIESLKNSSIYMNIGFKEIERKIDEEEQDWLLLELDIDSIRKECCSTDATQR